MILRFLKYWLPPLFWMSFIFFLSSRQSVTITGTFTIDFVIFKGLHMIEYGFLYLLLFRAFYSLKNKEFSLETRYILALVVAVAYAGSDELHQTFIASREGTIRDILIDTAGIILIYVYIKHNINWVKKLL
ncbi:hypothetical protein A2866_05120 [Candidatus Roizmanbacteria bacterium RIFCSPHIGHO2_01_FULL_39_8]|uniref:VanZ-like domain-containing protein n=3 Tax=Candidatus Roizmaniibacteriota TaxID=1752723 RepID=A0A1F7GH97_9BACT|nr:MAG: hypothetical protein A2866_05120 [Candidatus Roizmanbacteria bacterium RIFCSPHIGHO2_01_FULL_39_8]OGK28468.1 MAG: hypothetical protein A3C28_04105 [Candidatus Roizmanbacteria bacterium RIFCSPHIGHO2_02_FULL_39_9]OGK36583.1 MAG: hypothetical protein A3F60_00990 [Candidatus Roizmanbacteria bacterium RIFCSPHIGHO2_12_FULL_39_8]